MNLFAQHVSVNAQHPIYRRLLEPEYAPERDELQRWARGFVDRDGKFVDELQRTFEPCFWELYVHAALKELGFETDFTYSSPDFVLTGKQDIVVEATVARPAKGEKGPVGWTIEDIPSDFTAFNRDATVRLCNSFGTKVKRYREYYCDLEQCRDKPFVIAIGAYDRPGSHLSASRSILTALYGVYFDEDETLRTGSENVVSYEVEAAIKPNSAIVPVGLFRDATNSEVSAIMYSALATWGKLRALADNPAASSVYNTFHPNPNGIQALVRTTAKRDYREHLLDGLYVLHNPFATRPLDAGTLSHARVAEIRLSENGEFEITAPDDMLLARFVMSVPVKAVD